MIERFYITMGLLMALMLAVFSCSFSNRSAQAEQEKRLEIQRYDLLQYRFLTSGDYSALQQMNTSYPNETRTLIENVLQLGNVSSAGINDRFLEFFRDTTLQTLLSDVYKEYGDINDINKKLETSYRRLKKKMPELPKPSVYTQISGLSQSIVVGEGNSVGVSLDKYMGSEYPLYRKFYTERQRESMTRDYIVPDILTFYLVSLYQIPNFEKADENVRDTYIARIQYVVNYALDTRFYDSEDVKEIEQYVANDKKMTFDKLLSKKI